MKDLTQESDLRTYAIIGAAMEVHRLLGCGFLEPVINDLKATNCEVGLLNLALAQLSTVVLCLNLCNLCNLRISRYQLLKATNCEVGLLLNFGTRTLEYRRFVLSKSG